MVRPTLGEILGELTVVCENVRYKSESCLRDKSEQDFYKRMLSLETAMNEICRHHKDKLELNNNTIIRGE